MRRLFLSVLVLLLAAACGPSASQKALAARVTRLRAAGVLPAPGASAADQPALAPALARFPQLADELTGAATSGATPLVAPLAAPSLWGPEKRDRLHADLARGAAFLDDLARFLGAPETRPLLAGTPPHPLFASPGDGPIETPSLLLARHAVDLCCGRAIVAAEEGSPAEAAGWLGRALDVAHLVDDGGSLMALEIRSALEGIVLTALPRLLAVPAAHPFLRAELEPRLVRALDPDAARRDLAADVARVLDPPAEWATAWHGAFDGAPTASLLTALENWDHAEDSLFHGRFADTSEDIGRAGSLLTGASVHHRLEPGLQLARLALAAAHEHGTSGRWPATRAALDACFAEKAPRSPCPRVALAYEVGSEGARFALEPTTDEPGQDVLSLTWIVAP